MSLVAERVFVLVVDSDSRKDQRNAITDWLKSKKGIGFWHHIEHAWIVGIPAGESLTKDQIRVKAAEIMPDVSLMVLDVRQGDWSGMAPESGHQWLTDNLSK